MNSTLEIQVRIEYRIFITNKMLVGLNNRQTLDIQIDRSTGYEKKQYNTIIELLEDNIEDKSY